MAPSPGAPSPVFAPPRTARGPRAAVVVGIAVAGVLLAGALGAAYWGWSHPRLAFTNHLGVPVRLMLDGEAAGVVEAGATSTTRVARADSVLIRWEAAPPTDDAAVAGTEVAATHAVRFASHPLATARAQATAVWAEGAVFQPLVTNATGTPLRIIVNPGLSLDGRSLETDCVCELPPDARGASMGLHTLVGNSSVRAVMPDGRSATFANLGGSVDRRSGVVRLRFTPGAFRIGG